MKPSCALATLRHLAVSGLPAKLTQPTLSHLLRSLVPAETLTILWMDEDCNLHDLYSNHLCPREIGNHFVARYLNAHEGAVYVTHRRFMRGTRQFDLLHKRPNYRETAFFREFAAPMGFGRILRLAIRDADRPIAALWLTRPADSADFSSREIARACAAVPYLQHTLVGGVREIECNVSSGNEGWLVADVTGSVVYLAGETEPLLHMAAGIRRSQATLAKATYDWARPLLKQLARRVLALADGRHEKMPAIEVCNDSGRYLLRGQLLRKGTGTPANLIAVQISRRVPLMLRLLESPRVTALPPREKQACLLLVEGLPTDEIASRMGISGHGVVQHVRSLYKRLRIHRREDLLPALLPDVY